VGVWRVGIQGNGHRVRPLELIPEAQRVWVEDDPGFRRLFEVLDEWGPARAPRQEVAAECAMRSLTRFKRDFRILASSSWGAYRREWRLVEARRLLTVPFISAKDARLAVGWRSPYHFALEFERRFGVPPGKLREYSTPATPRPEPLD